MSEIDEMESERMRMNSGEGAMAAAARWWKWWSAAATEVERRWLS